jgi:ankyrin repeat protein
LISSLGTYDLDSFGDHIYINTIGEKPCSNFCRCLSYPPNKFTFTAKKSPAVFNIFVHSEALKREIERAVPSLSTSGELSTFVLLKHRDELNKRLKYLRKTNTSSPSVSMAHAEAEAELTLLVDGLLDDYEVFRSFGYDNLLQDGHISPNIHRSFQGAKAQRDVQLLETGFFAIDASRHPEQGNRKVIHLDRRIPYDVGETEYSLKSRRLWDAVQTNNLELTNSLLAMGADPDIWDPATGNSILITAIQSENLEMARTLVCHGAAVNYSWNRKVPLAEAMKTQNQSIVRVLLRADATYFTSAGYRTQVEMVPAIKNLLPSAGKLQPIYSYTLYDLQSDLCKYDKTMIYGKVWRWSYARSCLSRDSSSWTVYPASDIEVILIGAAARGDETHVVRILASAKHLQKHMGLSKPLVDPKFVHNGNTALTAAIQNGHHKIASLLLQYGADVNVSTASGTALSIAAKSGTETLIKDLIARGADLQQALLALNSSDETDVSDARRRLNLIVARKKRELLKQGETPSQELHLLYLEFENEFGNTMKATLSSENESPHLWASGFDQNSRKAFATSMGIMRGLINGTLPQTVNETIMFMNAAKAMSKVMEYARKTTRENDFEEDLARWQVVFHKSRERLKDFKDAVKAIWGVDLEQCQSESSPDEASLKRFQDMALNLMQRADEVFHLEELGDEGLMESQRRWRSLNHQSPFNTPGSDLESPPPIDDQRGDRHNSPSSGSGSETSISAEANCDFDGSMVGHSHIYVLIIAGTIFAIVVAFLMGM